MSQLQNEIISRFGVRAQINVEEEVHRRVNFLKDYILKAKAKGLLIAISGGLDSAVATGLCIRATDELTAEQGETYITLGVFQPFNKQEDIHDSYAVAEAFQLQHTLEVNIADAVDSLVEHTQMAMNKLTLPIKPSVSIAGKGNVKARVRMVSQYALAFDLQLLVVGTDHASEAITGFYTKWGDGAADIVPLQSLNKRQVGQLAAYLGVPESIINKAPTAGLWEGQTDEKELGIPYQMNSDYLEGKTIPQEMQQKLEAKYQVTEHKRSPIPGI